MAKTKSSMTTGSNVAPPILPQGELLKLKPEEINPSRNNPRQLFDRPELDELKNNIRTHGVLVPITVYQPKGSKQYTILDGARRHRCCIELENEGIQIDIPANVVNPPTKIAGLLYMFSIHNFREAWELMPTALALETVMEHLGETDNKKLKDLTGLSEPQIERCKKLLEFPEKYQNLSLDSNPKTRIPSNFWIELHPVLELCRHEISRFYTARTREGIIDRLVEKYQAKKIKSVIHFRRILEAFEFTDGDRRDELKGRLKEYIDQIDLETRAVFDPFITDPRRVQGAITACSDFMRQIARLKIEHSVDQRHDVIKALKDVRKFASKLIEKLRGEDDPELIPDDEA